MTAFVLLLSAIALVVTTCRLDHLTWREHPRLTMGHVLAGAAAAWPFTLALSGAVGLLAVAAAGASLAWLAVSYRRFERQVVASE